MDGDYRVFLIEDRCRRGKLDGLEAVQVVELLSCPIRKPIRAIIWISNFCDA